MKQTTFRTFYLLLLSILLPLVSQADIIYDKDEIRTRLEAMDCVIKPQYTTEVENYIKGYFSNHGYKTKLVLSRSVTYFPIFEKYLAEHGLPDDLKYIAVLESALNPSAVSRMGATGLWQIMKDTGVRLGLRIDQYMDERSCPNRSTMAAVDYMAKAYERFGDWELAIASYNCGTGNLLRAMKNAGGSQDYDEVSKFLPKETRKFVPAFLSAVYMMRYHHLHGIEPEYRHLDLQLTDSELVYAEMPFQTIAAIAGVPLTIVETLNPAYKKNRVPASVNGHWVVLPSRTMQAFRDYIHLLRPDKGPAAPLPDLPKLVDEADYEPNDYYYKSFYTTLEGDRLKELGKIFSCSGYNLKVWNNLTSEKLPKGKELLIWFPKEIKRYQPFGEKAPITVPAKPKPAKKTEVARPVVTIPKTLEPLKMGQIEAADKPQLPSNPVPVAVEQGQPSKKPKGIRAVFQKVKAWPGAIRFTKKDKKKN